MEKTIKTCNQLRERLKKIRRERRNRIIFAFACCVVAGIITSQFLIIGFSLWMFIAFFFVWAVIMIYNAREATLKKDKEEMDCKD